MNVINNAVAFLLFSVCFICPLLLCSSYPDLPRINHISSSYAILFISFSNVFSCYYRHSGVILLLCLEIFLVITLCSGGAGGVYWVEAKTLLKLKLLQYTREPPTTKSYQRVTGFRILATEG